MIDRYHDRHLIKAALRRSRVVALLGPRQCGKTTLARELVSPESENYFDLEDPLSLARLTEPDLALRPLKGLIVLDEIQRRPELFPLLRVLADRKPLPARFLILGSAAPELLRQSSETLAGRIETITLEGSGFLTLGKKLSRGTGFEAAFHFHSQLEAKLTPSFGVSSFCELSWSAICLSSDSKSPAATLGRFWTMVAHYHGQTWNSAELGRALAVSETTTRRYLDLMTGVFMVRQLQPWHENLAKRQVKAPKVYFRDSGLLHALLGIATGQQLEGHPKVGASWEGYALEEVLKAWRPDEAYFWATHNGAELDLLIFKGGKRFGIEFKRSAAPVLTPSMRIALSDLKLDHLSVVFPGKRRFSLADKCEAVPLDELVGLAPSGS